MEPTLSVILPALHEEGNLGSSAKTLLEAMACGLCVVGFEEGGLPDLARSGTEAWYCNTGDTKAFKDLLDRSLSDPARSWEIGQKAQACARVFTWDRTAQETEAFCLKLKNLALPHARKTTVISKGAGS